MRRYQNLAPWERALSVAIGTTLIGGAIRRRHLLSREAIGGVSLVARGVAGYCPVSHALGAPRRDDTRVALSGARGTSLKEHITIARPVREVFNFWRDLSHHPRFVRGLESVERTGDRTSRWTLRGPGGVRLQWEAEVINEVPPDLIAWRSLAGADVVSAGSVHFTPTGGSGTLVTVTMQYSRTAGHPGVAFSWMAGRSPASELRADLRRLKELLETGDGSLAEGQPIAVPAFD